MREPLPYLWCRCAEPRPQKVVMFGVWQCAKCHHKCEPPR